jgi:diguanylate cyclase (GGDEF)-like protein
LNKVLGGAAPSGVVTLPLDGEGDLLAGAQTALDRGEAQEASQLAREAAQWAKATGDTHREARCLAFLAHADRQLSRLRRAHAVSQRAAYLFRELGDTASEVAALSTLAHTAASLGRSEDAIEAGLMSVALGERIPVGPHLPLAFNYLGTAYFWTLNYAQAQTSFERALHLAQTLDPPVNPTQPLGNLAYLEAFRFAMQRFHAQPSTALPAMTSRIEALQGALGHWSGAAGLMPGITVTGHAMAHLLAGLLACWTGRVKVARRELGLGADWSQRYGAHTWLAAVREWLLAELAWASGDDASAFAHAQAMAAAGASAEHEPLACLGHVVASSLFSARGRDTEACAQLRLLKQREENIRLESQESRARVVAWQLESRQAHLRIDALESQSRMLEKLAYEDPLTGLMNRRGLQRRVEELEAGPRAQTLPLCLAMIDVDQFKRINDRHSHLVGDEVLVRLSALFQATVRQHDLVVRLAGDEFVILFEHTEHAIAQACCERVKAAVLACDWEVVARGLRVSVSIGVQQAGKGESIASVLARSDAGMYRDKARRPGPSPAEVS